VTEPGLPERLTALLERQARRRRAPRWVAETLRGRTGDIWIEEADDSRLVFTNGDGARFDIEIRLALPTQPAARPEPWRPEGIDLPDEGLWRLSYVVVDEIVEDAVTLSVSAWPGVDERGRLVFGDELALSAGTGARALRTYFGRVDFRGDIPETLRMGYAFAAMVRTAPLRRDDGSTLAPSRWLLPPVYDIHTRARAKAKEAFFAAVAPTLKRTEAERMEKTKPRR